MEDFEESMVEGEENSSLENPIIEKEYNIPLDISNKALKKAIKIIRKAIVIFSLFAMLIAIIIMIVQRSYGFGIFIIIICIFAFPSLLIVPKKIKKMQMDSIKGIDLYKFKLYDDCISLLALSKEDLYFIDNSQENEESEIARKTKFLMFDDNQLSIIENDDFYLLYQSKVMFYAVPKKDFSDAEILQMNEIFKEKLGKRFS